MKIIYKVTLRKDRYGMYEISLYRQWLIKIFGYVFFIGWTHRNTIRRNFIQDAMGWVNRWRAQYDISTENIHITP